MSYKHGVYVTEVPTRIVPPRRISAALPVVLGTAPVHLGNVESGKENKPTLFYTYQEAVEAFGDSTAWEDYTLCEFFKCFFGLFNVGPVVAINVFDPATHKTSVDGEAQTFANDKLTLDNDDVISATVMSADELTTYEEDTDYTIDLATGVITRLTTGSIPADDTMSIDYDHANPGAVSASDIVGSAGSGIDLVDDVFPMFRLVPGLLVAPGWSQDASVAAALVAKAGSINSGLFKAMALVDIDSDTVTSYSNVAAAKNTNNLTDEQFAVCWPKNKLGTEEYWASGQLAGLLASVDAENDDIPYKSPSNENYQMDAAVANGSEVWLRPEQSTYLNGQGIVTALNFIGGWKCWGNRTGAYPAVTDVKDSFLPVRRMFNWIANTLTLTFWQKVDFPITRRLIETVVDSGNIWLNGLVAREFLLAGRVEFQQDENPVTDTMDGIIKFHVYLTPPSPAREIDFILEYDPDALQTLFG